LAGEIPDRVPLFEMCFWPQTIQRWQKEGLPEGVSPIDFLEMDHLAFLQFDDTLGLEPKVLEDKLDYQIVTDSYGKTLKQWKNGASNYSPPQYLDHALKGANDWQRLKELLVPGKHRIPPGFYEMYQQEREKGSFICLLPDEAAWFMLNRTADVATGLMWFILEPELTSDIIRTQTEFILKMCELIVSAGIKPDAIWLSSDLCYKNGMLFSPDVYRRFVMPSHQMIKEFCVEHDLFLMYHCDGKVDQFIPLLIESGVDSVHPLEARSENDVRNYKGLFGDRITLIGNISVEVLSSDKKAIKKEVQSKMTVAKQNGRYIFHSDHSVPPTVSLDNYRYAVELARELGSYS